MKAHTASQAASKSASASPPYPRRATGVEPCSALDLIATVRVEELILALGENHTIVIMTHNMQQASRVSDRTAFFCIGDLIEYDLTSKIFSKHAENALKAIQPDALVGDL